MWRRDLLNFMQKETQRKWGWVKHLHVMGTIIGFVWLLKWGTYLLQLSAGKYKANTWLSQAWVRQPLSWCEGLTKRGVIYWMLDYYSFGKYWASFWVKFPHRVALWAMLFNKGFVFVLFCFVLFFGSLFLVGNTYILTMLSAYNKSCEILWGMPHELWNTRLLIFSVSVLIRVLIRSLF